MARKKNSKHGGARPGAGRPPKTPGDPTKRVCLSLRGSTVRLLDALGGSRSEQADRLIRQALCLDDHLYDEDWKEDEQNEP